MQNIPDFALGGQRHQSNADNTDLIGYLFFGKGSGVAAPVREQIGLAHPILQIIIISEALPPNALHQPTLLWALERADFVSLWIAEEPQFDDELDVSDRAVSNGAKFLVTIETTPANAAAWTAVIRQRKRKTAELVTFELKTVGGAQ